MTRVRRSWLLLCVVVASLGATARDRAPSPSLTFGGRIYAADGGPLEHIRVVATDGRATAEAIVDTSGIFVGAFPSAPKGRIVLRVFADSAARYHSSVVTLGPGVPDRPVRLVLIPTHWTISGGTFAGERVRIDPLHAVSYVSGSAGFWRLTRRGRTAGRPVAWVADSLPVRVAFRREPHDPRISPRDSADFWALAEELERYLGRPLFRPAPPDEIERGADGIFVTVDHRMHAAGRTFITYDESGRIFEAMVSVSRREFLGDMRVATHELLHAMGFGHVGAWASIMGPATRGITRPTPEDVAHAQLYFAIAELQRRHDVPYGILEAGRDFRF